MAISLYAAGTLLGKSLLPTVFGVAIHPFAWMIVVVTILAMLGWVPQETKAAAKTPAVFHELLPCSDHHGRRWGGYGPQPIDGGHYAE